MRHQTMHTCPLSMVSLPFSTLGGYKTPHDSKLVTKIKIVRHLYGIYMQRDANDQRFTQCFTR